MRSKYVNATIDQKQQKPFDSEPTDDDDDLAGKSSRMIFNSFVPYLPLHLLYFLRRGGSFNRLQVGRNNATQGNQFAESNLIFIYLHKGCPNNRIPFVYRPRRKEGFVTNEIELLPRPRFGTKKSPEDWLWATNPPIEGKPLESIGKKSLHRRVSELI